MGGRQKEEIPVSVQLHPVWSFHLGLWGTEGWVGPSSRGASAVQRKGISFQLSSQPLSLTGPRGLAGHMALPVVNQAGKPARESQMKQEAGAEQPRG